MSAPRTIGFPRMMKEPGEKRVFLPQFVQFCAKLGLMVFLEEGYGSRSGYSFEDFRQANQEVIRCSRIEAFQQDLVLVLRSPKREEYDLLHPGSCLISMLHYPTRPQRVDRLASRGLNAISLDSISNDQGIRLVENMKAVAWNGLEAAFDALEKRWLGLIKPDQQPINVFILGTGMVGKHAVEAATKLGNIERNNQHISEHGPGVIAFCAGRNLTSCPETMKPILQKTDILVDATQRRDTSLPVIPNEWLACLPDHAVIVDLAVDPYTLDIQPPVVRGIEGIPQGNLNKYTFSGNDPDWSQSVPGTIPSANRRTVVSCYSWPGIHPEACMHHYALQLEPLMEVLVEKGYDGLSPEGSYFERALYRATLTDWCMHEHYQSRLR